MSGAEELPHSAIYFGDARDFWWNHDFVALMAQRLELSSRWRVLDVGCGYGHWTRVIAPHLPTGFEMACVDPEPRSLAEAASRNRPLTDRGRFSYAEGRAEALPFADGTFDMVTAQTVLIHVPDVAKAIAEMARVLAPGGLLLLVEPNNLLASPAQVMNGPEVDPALLVELFALEAFIQRGKHLLGEGHLSAGEWLPRHLDRRLFGDVRMWMSDRPISSFPPYDGPGQREDLAERRAFLAKGWYGRPREEALRFYLAGGGDRARFEAAYETGLASERKVLAEIEAGRHAIVGGHAFYLVAATKLMEARTPG